MAKVGFRPVSVDKSDPRRALQQLEDAHNQLLRDLNHILTNIDNSNITQAFSEKIGGA